MVVTETVRETPDDRRPALSSDKYDGSTRAGILAQLLAKFQPLKKDN